MIIKKNSQFFFLFIIFIFGCYCALTIGKSWDTFHFINAGKERLKYLLSLGLVDNEEPINPAVYPAIYNTLSAFVLQLFPRKFELEVFHLINFSVSFLTAIGVYKISKKLFNKEIGRCAFLIFILLPIFFGHTAINDRDTIVTFCNIWTTYYVFQYLKFNSNKKYIFHLGFLLALGTGVRFAFIATLLPLIIYSIFLIYKKINKEKFKQISVDIFKTLFISIFLIILLWTPTHENIFLKPYELIKASFEFAFGYPYTLLNGEIIQSNNVSGLYVISSQFFKTPEYIIVLYIIFGFFILQIQKNLKYKIENFNTKVVFIVSSLLLPNILILLNPFAIYDGIRFFMFSLPYLAIVPAIAINFLFKNYEKNLYKTILIFLLILKIYFLYTFILLTPFHYTYLNLFAGKFSKSHDKFENDYWGTSLKELSKKIEKNKVLQSDEMFKLVICGVGKGSTKYYLNKIKDFKYQIVSENENPDFVILTNRILTNYNKKKPKLKTCFDKYSGRIIEKVSRKGLILSAIKEFK